MRPKLQRIRERVTGLLERRRGDDHAGPRATGKIRERVTGLVDRARGDDHAGASAVDTFTCECGQAFRITGRDRHRVLWPEGAGRDEPVLSGRCPACDRPLPGANAA
jgi:hypothetical protein